MGKIYLRHASNGDREFLFHLVNDEECRKNSLNSQHISIEEHKEWFEKVSHSRTQRIYILMEVKECIGQGRLEFIDNKCRISYSIIPERRGFGYGKNLLELLGNAIIKEFPQCKIIYGEVLKKNVASQKIFEDLGYTAEDKGDFFSYCKDISFIAADDIKSELDANCVCGGGIILLSNNRNAFSLYQWLSEQEEFVYFYSGKLIEIQIQFLSPKLIISYNYSYLIPKQIIQLVENRIINLHISYLPWNKGSDPNFWSFIENTPKGVTIHQLSSGLDQGDILLQKEIDFDEHVETFQTTYDTLNKEIVLLLQENWDKIKEQSITPKKQIGTGSYHKKKDLIEFLEGEQLSLQETIYNYKSREKLKK